jgi:CheY-like chemotaxis protein
MANTDLPASKPRPFILVIDDDSSCCLILSKLIRSLNYEVMTTNSPKSAFLYELTDNDIVFIDITMPGMDGFEVMNTFSDQNAKCSVSVQELIFLR